MRRLIRERRPEARRAVGPILATALVLVVTAGGADARSNLDRTIAVATAHARHYAGEALAWYRRTPPADRVTWGGLGACAALGLSVLTERSWRLRQRRVLPTRFVDRFLDRLRDGQLEPGKGTDLCELNPSPASRIALAALKRWGRPSGDVERAVAMARQVEADRLRRNVGTLRRIAAMAPLIGLLGTLLAAGRALSGLGEGAGAASAWGPALAGALAPLTAGVGLAILALVAYDGLIARVEALGAALDRLGAETADAVAVLGAPKPAPAPRPDQAVRRGQPAGPHFGVPAAPRHGHGRRSGWRSPTR